MSSGRPCSCAKWTISSGVERDQRDRVRAPVAVHHGLRDPARLLEVVLEVRRREVLAARRDDDVLLAAGDLEVAVLVELAEVAGVQPAVLDRAERRVVVLVVALEDVRAPDQDLAVVGDPDLDARQRPADRAELVGVLASRPSTRSRSRSSRSPRAPARRRRRRTRGSPGRSARRPTWPAQPAAEDVADVAEQLLRSALSNAPAARRDRLAGLLQLADLQPELARGLDLLRVVGRGDQRVDLLEDPRHRRQVGRLDLGISSGTICFGSPPK